MNLGHITQPSDDKCAEKNRPARNGLACKTDRCARQQHFLRVDEILNKPVDPPPPCSRAKKRGGFASIHPVTLDCDARHNASVPQSGLISRQQPSQAKTNFLHSLRPALHPKSHRRACQGPGADSIAQSTDEFVYKRESALRDFTTDSVPEGPSSSPFSCSSTL